MRCNNELSPIHFCKEITDYCIASVNWCLVKTESEGRFNF